MFIITINRQLHAFSCNLGIIAFPTGFNCTRYARAITSLLVMQLFPNYTQKHVITYTNSIPNVAVYKISIKNYTCYF